MSDVASWLLEGDPSIRWQVMRDLTGAPAAEVAAERATVAGSGQGERLLGLYADGAWAGGACSPRRSGRWNTLRALRVLQWYHGVVA